MDNGFMKFIQFSKVTSPKVANENKNLNDYDADISMIDNLEGFAPKIAKMMEVIVDDDDKRSKGAYSIELNGSKLSTLTKRFKQHAAGTDKPPLSHLGIHFIFLPTEDGSTLFDGEKEPDRGRLLCRGQPKDRGRCLGTISYAMKAYGIRVLTTNPKIKIGVDLDKDPYYKLLGWEQKNKDFLESASEKKPKDATDDIDLCGKDVKSKIDCIHKKFETSLEDCFKTLLKVLGMDQGDDISASDCWKVCKALGGIPAATSTLATAAGIIAGNDSQKQLKCQWKRKIRELPQAVQKSLNQNGNTVLLERYRGMLDARNNKAALQFFLEIIHRGTLDEQALKAGKIVVKNPEIACNYKRAIMFTSPVVAEDAVKKLFIEPLNQDGLLVRFIAVHLPRAVGLNIKPADVIHKPDTPDNDGSDIQSSARAMRSCPFHKNNLSECIAEQAGGVHRRCYTSNNIVLRRDYQFAGEGGLKRLEEQKTALSILRDIMAEYSADCVDHADLHMRKNPDGSLDSESILASVQVNGKSIPACQRDRAVKKNYTSYPFLQLMEFMPLTKSEFMYILFKHSREKKKSYGKFDQMINTLNVSGSVTNLTKMMLRGFGEPLITENKGIYEGIIGTMLKHPKLKKDISLVVFGKNNMNNVSKQLSEIVKGRKSLGLEISNFFNFQLPDVEGWSDADVIIESLAKMVSLEPNVTNNTFNQKNVNDCASIEIAARSPMNINKTKNNNNNANNVSIKNDIIAKRCIYFYTWQFLSKLVIKYYNASLMMLKHRKKPNKEDLFLHIFNFIKGLINVSQRNGVSNKFIERIPVLYKLTEYIKHLNSQKTHEFEKIFQTIRNQGLNDPKKLTTIEVLSSGRMFVISAYLLRSKLGIQNVTQNNTSNNGVKNLLNNLNNNNNNNNRRGSGTINQSAASSNLNGNLGSAAKLRDLNNMNVSASKSRSNSPSKSRSNSPSKSRSKSPSNPPNPGPGVFSDFRPRTTRPQGVKRTISAGTARKTRWDRKAQGNKERKERNAMERRGMNRFASPVHNNNNDDSESAMRRKIARNQAKFEENEFNEIARGGGYQNSPNNGDAFGDFRPRTTRQRVKRTISPGTARKTRWDKKVKREVLN